MEMKAGETVYTILKHRSNSGMLRYIDAFVIRNEIGYKWNSDKSGFKVGGCGMDMGFSLVFNISRVLFKEFICIGQDCPANDHLNGDRDYSPHKHTDGGYALTQRWL